MIDEKGDPNAYSDEDLLTPIHICGGQDKLVQPPQRGGDLATRVKILNAHISFYPVIPLLEIYCLDNFTHEHLTKYVQDIH